MKTVPVNAERAYQVEIGVDWEVALTNLVKGRNKVIAIASSKFEMDVKIPVIKIPDGESGKSPEILLQVWRELGDFQINRGDLIVGIGGGSVTDLAGFAAATWMRGIDWVAIPTTIAGMVDAAVGGKTGVNSEHGKNQIGSFHSPISVLIDLSWITTLSERDVAAGLAEVVKCGFIADSHILELLKNKSLNELMHDQELLMELIYKAVSVKAAVVSADFKESFLREVLNYGHTLGHAIEKHSKYQLRHGEAVAIGMCFVAQLANIKGHLNSEIVQKHYEILAALKLPINYESAAWPELVKLMTLDKKNREGLIRFVAISSIGNCIRIEDADLEEMALAYERISK
jgi:3-dehydroquinate synthase